MNSMKTYLLNYVVIFLFMVSNGCSAQRTNKVSVKEKKEASILCNTWLEKNKESVGVSKVKTKALNFAPEEGYWDLKESVSSGNKEQNKLDDYVAYTLKEEYISTIDKKKKNIHFFFNDSLKLILVRVYNEDNNKIFDKDIKE